MVRLVCRGEAEPRFSRPTGMPEALFALLCARGIESEAEAAAFLSPSLDQLHDPMLLSSMAEVLALIDGARRGGQRVCVYGDYDVDGVCATAILGSVLGKLGLRVKSFIPKRHGDGYGLNEAAVREIAQWAGLLITVDCGITALAEVDLCRKLGLSVIVTDHHRPGELLPDCPVVNPLLDGYPFPSLCGAGVAFKLALALDRRLALAQLDLACLATVADVVPLLGENRAIVACGLEAIRANPRPGVLALAAAAGIKLESLRASSIAFGLAPRLNAGGRLGDADRALQLLICKNADEAEPLARELEAENQLRRGVEQYILAAARAQMEDFDFASRRCIVLHGADWNVGVIGLAASRLVEQYHMPVVLLSGEGPDLVGSCRSIPGVDIHMALTACSALLVRFGGHKQAAGLTLAAANLELFTEALDGYLRANADPAAYVPSMEYDLALGVEDMTHALVGALARMEPFGFGNPAPVVLTEAKVDSARTVGQDGAHLSLKLSDGGAPVGAIGFRMGARLGDASGWLRVLHQPKLNEFNGRTSVQMELRAMLPPRPLAQIHDSEPSWDAMERAFLTEVVYNWTHSSALDIAPLPFADASDVARLLAGSAYGTLVVATDRDALAELIETCAAAGVDDRFDLLMGRWPDVGAPMNAVCALPRGQMPGGYARIVMLDAPGALLGGLLMGELMEPMSARARWLSDVPGVDDLRTLFVCVRDLLRRPQAQQGIEAALGSLAQDGRISGAAAAMGLPVLSHMGLIDLQLNPPRLAMGQVKRADPEQNRTFDWLQTMRAWGR